MHSSLWTAAWTRAAAEQVAPLAAGHGLDVIEIALLEPAAVDVPHSRALFERHGIKHPPARSACRSRSAPAPSGEGDGIPHDGA
ncbi:MAG: hypothetical protein R3D25_02285 [Geminicoccaceae bacterium]